MKHRRLLVVASSVVALVVASSAALYAQHRAALQDAVNRMKDAVTKDFHDPDTARFRNVQLKSDQEPLLSRLSSRRFYTGILGAPNSLFSALHYDPQYMERCGEGNAKNAFGAYVGYKAFYVGGGAKPNAFIDTTQSESFVQKMCAIQPHVIYTEP